MRGAASESPVFARNTRTGPAGETGSQSGNALSLDTLFRLSAAASQSLMRNPPMLGSALGSFNLLGQTARGRVIFSLNDSPDSRSGRIGIRPQSRGQDFQAPPQTTGEVRRNRFDLSAIAAVGAGGRGAFLGASSAGGMSAGISSFGKRSYSASSMGFKPAATMSGPPGTSASAKSPTASVTLRLSF
jgi:hypothetical protein